MNPSYSDADPEGPSSYPPDADPTGPSSDESSYGLPQAPGIKPSPGYKEALFGPNGYYSDKDESDDEGWIDLTSDGEDDESKCIDLTKAKRSCAESPERQAKRRKCTRFDGDGTAAAPYTLSEPPDFSAILDLLAEASKHDSRMHDIPTTLQHVLASSLFHGKEQYDFDDSALGVKAFAKRMLMKWQEFQRNRAIATKNFAQIAAL